MEVIESSLHGDDDLGPGTRLDKSPRLALAAGAADHAAYGCGAWTHDSPAHASAVSAAALERSASPQPRGSSLTRATVHIELSTALDLTLHNLLHTPLYKLSVASANIRFQHPTTPPKVLLLRSPSTGTTAEKPPSRTPPPGHEASARKSRTTRPKRRDSTSRLAQYRPLSAASPDPTHRLLVKNEAPAPCDCGLGSTNPASSTLPDQPSQLAQPVIHPDWNPFFETDSQELGSSATPPSSAAAMNPSQPGDPLEEVSISLGDEESLREFYETRFRSLQQIPCKSIAKDWIKVIEPRKQTLHPYNGGERAKGVDKSVVDVGELCKPDWWPPEGCRHREPDHISRQERLVLLMHLLRNLWDPDSKDGPKSINVEKLQAATTETVASWSTQAVYHHNRIILEGIYNVRRAEERLRNNETDASEDISCPAIPRTLYATRKPKKTAGSKRRFDGTALRRSGREGRGSVSSNSSAGSTQGRSNGGQQQQQQQNQQQQQQQGSYRQNSYANGSLSSYTLSPTSPADPWHRNSTGSMVNHPHLEIPADDVQGWPYAPPETARMPAQVHYAAEPSLSPANMSDEHITSPRTSTHPSSASSEFSPVAVTTASASVAAMQAGLSGGAMDSNTKMADADFEWGGNGGGGGGANAPAQFQQEHAAQFGQMSSAALAAGPAMCVPVAGGAPGFAPQWAWNTGPAGAAAVPAPMGMWAPGAVAAPMPPVQQGGFGMAAMQQGHVDPDGGQQGMGSGQQGMGGMGLGLQRGW